MRNRGCRHAMTCESVTDPTGCDEPIGYFHRTMMRSTKSRLCTLSLAFPAASWALGLGDIRVGSALDQPLEAQIELIGALPDDAATLTAHILDDAEFRQHGLERPSFLSGSTLTVGTDAQGDPTLFVNSIERVTEPMVTLLVGLDFPSGRLVREYTVLLDPLDRVQQPVRRDAGSTTQAVAGDTSPPATAVTQASSVFATPGPASENLAARPPQPPQSQGSHLYTVAAHDTLGRIARSAGASSESELRKMAVVIYHANPEAFRANNLNLLRQGATLRLPGAEQLAALSAQDADREYAAQMQVWRTGVHRIAPAAAQTSHGSSPATVDSRTRGGESDESQVRLLAEQVQSLQRSLHELQQELNRPLVIPATTPIAASSTGASAPARDPVFRAAEQVRPEPAAGTKATPASRAAGSPRATLTALICGALVLLASIWFRRWRHSAGIPSKESLAAEDPAREIGTRQPKSKEAPLSLGTPAPGKPARNDTPDPTAELPMPAADDTVETAELPAAVEASDATGTFNFFNPQHLADTTHVVMSSRPSAPFAERRKNPADVLRQAIEREPHRSDLRLKLLELYYVGLSQNRRAFLEIVRELAKKEGVVSPEDWSRILAMGRAIAPDDELFAVDTGSKAVA